MPVTVKEVNGLLDQPNMRMVKEVCDLIDSKLRDAEWVRMNKYGTDDAPFFIIVAPGTLTASTKREIASLYEQAGWTVLRLCNSEDNDERAGLWSIRLQPRVQMPSL